MDSSNDFSDRNADLASVRDQRSLSKRYKLKLAKKDAMQAAIPSARDKFSSTLSASNQSPRAMKSAQQKHTTIKKIVDLKFKLTQR